jgi:hypothetical protein
MLPDRPFLFLLLVGLPLISPSIPDKKVKNCFITNLVHTVGLNGQGNDTK